MAAERLTFSVNLGLKEVIELFLQRTDAWRTRDERQLSTLLKRLVALLEAISDELKKGKVPHRNGRELADLMASGARLAKVFKKRDVKLALIFEHELPKVGRLLREADFFIDGTPRDPHHYAVREGITTVDTKRKKIAEARTEIERAAGSLSAYTFTLEGPGTS